MIGTKVMPPTPQVKRCTSAVMSVIQMSLHKYTAQCGPPILNTYQQYLC